MSEFVVRGVPTAEVKNFCRMHKALGATKCQAVDVGGGKSDVTVGHPDDESADTRNARLNR